MATRCQRDYYIVLRRPSHFHLKKTGGWLQSDCTQIRVLLPKPRLRKINRPIAHLLSEEEPRYSGSELRLTSSQPSTLSSARCYLLYCCRWRLGTVYNHSVNPQIKSIHTVGSLPEAHPGDSVNLAHFIM